MSCQHRNEFVMAAPTISVVSTKLAEWAPLELAESWDNVGLLVGDPSRSASRIMTCLTLSEDVADEAIAENVDLIVTHHPLPFRPLTRIVTDRTEGRILWNLIVSQTAIYCPHTAYDSATEGVNQQWANMLGLSEVEPLLPSALDPTVGTGRVGSLSQQTNLACFAELVSGAMKTTRVRVVGSDSHVVTKVVIACGSGGSLFHAAIDTKADAMVTGEATFHDLLAARAAGMAVVLTGHYASERFALESLADRIADEFPTIAVWASRHESDPIRAIP